MCRTSMVLELVIWYCQTIVSILLTIYGVQGLVNENSSNCERIKSCEMTRSNSSSNTIYFGLMLSFPDPQNRDSLVGAFDDGHDIAPAAYLAVEQINSRSDLLREYEIRLIRLDGGCNVTERSVVGITELSCSCKTIVGIIGPTCGTSSMIIGDITGKKEFSLITIHYGQDELLGNRTLFPYTFGILGSTSKYVDTVVELVIQNQWKRIGILYSEDNIYIARSRAIQERVKKIENYEISFASAIYDNYIPLKDLKKSFTRIIMVIGTPGISLRTICLAYYEKMVFPDYQWVFVERTDSDFRSISFTFNGNLINCTKTDISQANNGNIGLLFGAVGENDATSKSKFGVTLQQYQEGYQMHIKEYIEKFNAHSTAVDWSKGIYDAVWSLAIAVNGSLGEIGVNLTHFKTGSNILTRAIAKHMLKVNFQGVSGQINFIDETGYNTNVSVSLYQYTSDQNSSSKRIGVCNSTNNLTLFRETNPTFVNAQFEETVIHVNVFVTSFLLSLTLLIVALAIPLQIIYIVYHNYRSIKASSPWLNNLIFVGCYFIAFSSTLHLLIETFKDLSSSLREHLCNAIPWFLTTGTTMIMGTILVKTWRLYRIYTHSKRMNKEPILLLNMKLLFGFLIFLIFLDITVCIVWTSTDKLKLIETKTLQYLRDNDYPMVAVYHTWHSVHTVYWIIALLIPKVAIMFTSFFLALFTRFNIKEFRTTNVVVHVYLLTILSAIVIPTYIVILVNDVGITIRVTIICLFFNLFVYTTIFFSLIPPVHAFIKKKYTTLSLKYTFAL